MKKPADYYDFIHFLEKLLKPHSLRFIIITTLVLIYSLSAIYLPKILGKVINMFGDYKVGSTIFFSSKFTNLLIEATVLILITYILKIVITYITYPVSDKITLDLRERIDKKVHSINYKYLNDTNSGEIMSRINHDTLVIRGFVGVKLSTIISKMLLLILAVFMMLMLDWELTKWYLLIMIVSFIFIALINKYAIDYMKESREYMGKMISVIGDTLLNKTVVNKDDNNSYSEDRFDKLNLLDKKAFSNATTRAVLIEPISLLMSNLVYIIIYVIAIIMLFDKTITLNIVLELILYGQIIINQLKYFGKTLREVQTAYSSFIKIYDFLHEPDEEENIEKVENISHGEIEFKNVSFSYDDKKILDNVNFKIGDKTKTIVKGKVSSGKSTITNLLTKFYEIDSGEILLDGKNITNIPQKNIIESCTILSENNQLYTASVMENIAYSTDNISHEDIVKAAKEVGSHEFIMKLPEQYDTIISDENNNLSRGERELILLTRAYVKESKILIIDNVMSNIDNITKQKAIQSLRKLMQNKTTIILTDEIQCEYDNIIQI
ncbi:ABC transporter ATP-binding protein [Methanosphaera sp. ISO3-F5]|uniref:ABC transporter ATP-binding protein n=1 Tax=Methanosphaera sp. ISO3-F5 TaxID=1452353 RepID=UPI002B261052|nr:ABC transporter ATP-binding protein [Methanosphaera sp. ISO3-F5]WQH64510.1 ABC transporter ATP-binding protein [Methanosphaera sp. ISO3-F5]